MFKRILSGIISAAMVVSAAWTGSFAFAAPLAQADTSVVNLRRVAEDSGDTYIVNKGDAWYYKRDTAGSSWKNNGFLTDPDWSQGITPIGYGYTTPALGTDMAKGEGSANVYLQKTFTLDSITNIKSVLINIDADDYAKVYLNGTQIYYKTTDSDVNKNVTAVYPDEDGQGGSSGNVYLSSTALKTGENIISVDLINATQTSSDLYFDMAFAVSTNDPTTSSDSSFYEKLMVTPGEDESKLNFSWYAYSDDPVIDYYVNADYNDSQYCTQAGQDGGGFYFNDGNTKTVYKLPLDKSNAVKGIVAVDVAQNYTVELSSDGTNYTQVAVAPNGAGVAEMGKENRAVLTFVISDYIAADSDCLYVRIGDQTTANGWGGCIYNVKVSYLDSDGDNVGDIIDGIADALVQIVKISELSGGEMPEITDENTFEGFTSDAVSGYTSNKVVCDVELNTEYAYRIGQNSTGEWSSVYYTSTQNAGSDYSFIYVGDAQLGAGSLSSDTERWLDTMNKAQEAVPDASFILSAGDQVNTGSNENEYASLTDAEQLQSTPFVPAIGNHDANDINWTYHYNVPNVTENGKTGAGTDYYFFYGETVFVVLNGNNSSAAEHKDTIDQAINAYKEANGGNEPRWKIALMHQDIYGSGQQHSMKVSMVNFRKAMYPVFDEYEFDVVLTGHDHTYTRSYIMKGNIAQKDSYTGADGQYVDPDGTLYITANSSSGSKYYPLCPVRGTYVDVRNQYNVPSYSSISITDNEFTIKTYRTDTNEIYDECTVAKDATNDDLAQVIEEAEAVEDPSGELTSAIEAAKALGDATSAEEKTQAFEALNNNIPRAEIHDGADITSFKIGDREGTITEVLTYGDKQADGTYKYDNEIINLEDTVPVTGTITLKVPNDTDLTTVVPDIEVSEGATYSFNKTSFVGAVVCTVTSERGNLEHKYTITVSKEADYSTLSAVIAQAEALNAADYTATSMKAVTDALKTAKALIENRSTSQTSVDNARIKLSNAINALVKNTTNTGSGSTGTTTTPAVTNGTATVNGKTVLYVTGKQVTGTKVVTVSGKTYAVVGGYVKTGKKQVVKIKSLYYIVNKLGVVQKGTKNKLIKVGTKSYVVNKNGVVQRKASGNKLVKVGTKSYIVNKLGVVQKGTKNKLVKIGKKAYIVNKKGVIQKNKKSIKVGKKTYKTNKKGVATLKK